ncbi:hypothetical protein BC943DRAFT_7061 [Umbelopsis sp. AD052]|nr:hypothetical protein BC943DRAFT_7061 [Umbelopsis sp. AD052]
MQGPLPLAVIIEDACLDLETINMKKDPSSANDVPLPKDAQSFLSKIGIEQFDLNSFVLRIVSVDRSSEQRRSFDDDAIASPHQSPSIDLADSATLEPNPVDTTPFRIPEDAQIYSYDSEGKFYSFTQYLTLFDISARGYVRPVSISYVTKDPHKILPRFSIFMERFSKVSHILKVGNFPNFARDLHYRLQDLEYTESQMASQQVDTESKEDNLKEGNDEPNKDASQLVDGNSNLTMEALQQAIGELKATIDQVEHHPVLFSSKIQESESEQSSNVAGEKEVETAKMAHEQQKDKNTEEKQRSNSVASSVVAMTRTVSRGLSSVTDMIPFKGPWSSAFLENRRNRESQLDATAGDSPDSIHQADEDGRPLDSSLNAKYEPQIVHSIFPVTASDRRLRTLSQLCSPLKQPIITQDDVRKTILLSPTQEFANPKLPPNAADMLPQPSHSLYIALDKYAESINEIMDIVRDLGRNSVSLDIQDEDLDVARPSSAILSIGRTMVMNFKNPAPRRIGAKQIEEEEEKNATENSVKVELGGHRIRGERLYVVDDKSTILPTRKERSSSDSEEKTSSSIPSLGEANVDDKVPSANYILSLIGGQVWDRNDGDPGTGLKNVLHENTRYIKHVIFAIMSGRTTLVVGGASSEENVKSVVLALSLFVPGHSKRTHRVIKWHPDALTEDMLTGVKLIGVPKDKVNTSIYAMDVSVFDLDNVETAGHGGSLLCGPLYVDGHWIDDMISHAYTFPSDAALIAHIHTIFFNIALKAYILYHAFIHNDQVSEFIPEPAIDTTSATTSAEAAKDSQKWSMRKLMDYWRRIDERQTNFEKERGNVLDSVFSSSDSPEKLHTWSDANTNSLDLRAFSNLMANKDSDLASERPQFLSLSSMHESNLLRQQIAKAAANRKASTSQDNNAKDNADLTNHEQNEATVTLQSIAASREQRPALADLDWSQGDQGLAISPQTIPIDNPSHADSDAVTRDAVPQPYGSLQSDFSGLSSVTGATSCYYTSNMTASELQNEESFSQTNEEDDEDTGSSTGSESCSSEASDDDSRASPAPPSAKPSDLQSYDESSLTGQAAEEGRRFMMEELGLSGDDQTIVVVSKNELLVVPMSILANPPFFAVYS